MISGMAMLICQKIRNDFFKIISPAYRITDRLNIDKYFYENIRKPGATFKTAWPLVVNCIGFSYINNERLREWILNG